MPENPHPLCSRACFERNSTLRGRIPGIVNTKNSRDFLGIGVKAIGVKNLNQ